MHLDADVVREVYATQPAFRSSASTLVTSRIILKQDGVSDTTRRLSQEIEKKAPEERNAAYARMLFYQ
jgi:hypothetical protein